MIDFYHNYAEGRTRLSGRGSPIELAADIAVCATVIFARTKAASPIAAAKLKKALKAVFDEDSPIWTTEVEKATEADSFSVITLDRREAERQTREDQNADA